MNSSLLSLDARIFDSGNRRTPPTAPPRKKRSTLKKGSTLPTGFGSENLVQNGFKDLFINGGGAVRSLTYDEIEYIDIEEGTIKTKAQVEFEKQSSIDRKLRVGNKKTDKFFGEALSDHLSDEPVEVERTTKIESTTIVKETSSVLNDDGANKDEVDRRTSSTSDKKLFFLMNMLEEEFLEEEKYKDKIPVDEPIFIAKKKEIKKHICDDDDRMHNHFHHHDTDPCDHHVAPPKPDRDFSKYQKKNQDEVDQPVESKDNASDSNDQKATTDKPKVVEVAFKGHADEATTESVKNTQQSLAEKLEEPQAKVRTKRMISRENLPSPPETPKRKSGAVISQPSTPIITVDHIEFNSHQVDADLKSHSDGEKKPKPRKISGSNESDDDDDDEVHVKTSNAPIIAHDLVDRMLKKAYGFHDYHPEDFTEHSHDDGSAAVMPTSKLTVRKISVTRKVSTETAPLSLDAELVAKANERMSLPYHKTSVGSMDSGDGSTEAPPKSPTQKARDYEKLLSDPSINDIIEEIYSKNSEVMKDFQSYLEKSVEADPVINVDDEKAYLTAQGLNDHQSIRTPEPHKLPDTEDDGEDNHSFSDSFESTDTEQETVTTMHRIALKIPRHSARRESIEDVDNWFNNHLDLEEKKSQYMGGDVGKNESPTGYDTGKIFPFGRTITGRRDSLSDEFFSQHPQVVMRPSISVLRESESSAGDENEKEEANHSVLEKSPDNVVKEKSPNHSIKEKSPDHSVKEKSPDHSTLLKFLEQESKEN